MKGRTEYLVCYDVSTVTVAGERRLRQMSKACVAFGQRVQYSTFELSLTPALLQRFLDRALKIIDVREDSLRVYRLESPREQVVKVYGRDGWTDFDAPLIV